MNLDKTKYSIILQDYIKEFSKTILYITNFKFDQQVSVIRFDYKQLQLSSLVAIINEIKFLYISVVNDNELEIKGFKQKNFREFINVIKPNIQNFYLLQKYL